jgi:hypothetical protein
MNNFIQSGGYQVVNQFVPNTYFNLLYWEQNRTPIQANVRGKLNFIINTNQNIEYEPNEQNFIEILIPNTIAIPDRIYCEFAEIPNGYHLYDESYNLFTDLEFFPATDCTFIVYSESVEALNKISNDSYFDGNVEKSNSSFDTDKFYSNSGGYQLDHNLYTIVNDASLNGYTKIKIIPHPELPLMSTGGNKFALRLDAKYDERDEGFLFSKPGRYMVQSNMFVNGIMTQGNVHELTVKSPKVPYFHMDISHSNARNIVLSTVACEFFEKISFKTSNYLSPIYDKILIYFETSDPQFFADLGINGNTHLSFLFNRNLPGQNKFFSKE